MYLFIWQASFQGADFQSQNIVEFKSVYKNATISVSIKDTIEMLVVSIKSLFYLYYHLFHYFIFQKNSHLRVLFCYYYMMKHVNLYQIDNSFKELTLHCYLLVFIAVVLN